MTQQLPQIGATVRRIEPPTNGLATVCEVQRNGDDYSIGINYAEGGQAWWPLECLEIVNDTTADWARFKRIALNSDTLNQIIATAYESAPVAAGALASALLRAESGDVSDFADAWKKITRAVDVPAEVITGFVGVAQACQLPPDFVAALEGTPREN